MKFVYVYGQELPNSFANSGAVLSLCSALAALGHQVTLAYPGNPATKASVRAAYGLHSAVELDIVRVRPGSAYYPTIAFDGAHLAGNGVVITRMPAVAVMTALLRSPVVLELHMPLSMVKRWRIWRCGLVMVPARRLAIAALTPSLANSVRRDPLASRYLTAIVPSAAPDFTAAASEPDYDVGYLGSFRPGKGIELVATIATSRPKIRFIVFGDQSENPLAASRLRNLDNVTLAGHVPRSELAMALGRFRIGLAPYGRGGFGWAPGTPNLSLSSVSPLKVVEYMSAGKAIVASAVPPVEAIVSSGETALLCDPDRPNEWIEAIDRLLVDNRELLRLTENARRLFRGEYDYDTRAKRFAALARQVSR